MFYDELNDGPSYSNEFQAAFDAGRALREPDDPRIAEALQAGKVVLIARYPTYCPYTDAINGSHASLDSVYETMNAARQAWGAMVEINRDSELDYQILPEVPQVVHVPRSVPDDEVPF